MHNHTCTHLTNIHILAGDNSRTKPIKH